MRRYFTTEGNPDYLPNELKAMKNLHQMFKAAYLFVATSFGKIDRDWCDGFVNKHSVLSEWGDMQTAHETGRRARRNKPAKRRARKEQSWRSQRHLLTS